MYATATLITLVAQSQTTLTVRVVMLQVSPTQAVDITILSMKIIMMRMTCTMKTVLKHVKTAQSQYRKANLVIGKSLTETVTV